MTLGKFIIKVDGVNELDREVKVWNPENRKEYDCDIWRVNKTIYIVPKLSEDEVDSILEDTPVEGKEGGCHTW